MRAESAGKLGKAWIVGLALLSFPALGRGRPDRDRRCPMQMLDRRTLNVYGQNTFLEAVTIREYLIAEYPTAQGPYHAVLQITTSDGPGDFRRKVFRRVVRRGAPRAYRYANLSEATELFSHPQAEQIFYSFIEPILELNIQKYAERRDWTRRFRRKLKQIAHDYLNDSVYVMVERKSDGKIVGGVRFILAPYGIQNGKIVAAGKSVERLYGPVREFRTADKKTDASGLPLPPLALPWMEYLDIDVARPAVSLPDAQGIRAGMLVEIGTLFVEETLTGDEQSQVWAEWLIALEELAHETGDDHFSYYAQSFQFIADPLSERIYSPWKYTPLRQYRIRENGVWRDVRYASTEAPERRMKDGTSWLPVAWYPGLIDDFFLRFTYGKVPFRRPVNVLARRYYSAMLFNPYGMRLTPEPDWLFDEMVRSLGTDMAGHWSWESIGVMTRIVDLYSTHRHMARTGEPEVAARARQSAEAMRGNVERITREFSKIREHPQWIVRNHLAWYFWMLLGQAGERDILTMREIVRDYIFPMILDPDYATAFQALRGFAGIRFETTNQGFAGLTLDEIRVALQLTGDVSARQSAARARLQEKGLTEPQIAALVTEFRVLLDASRPGSDGSVREASIARLLELLTSVRAAGPAIVEPLVVLALGLPSA